MDRTKTSIGKMTACFVLTLVFSQCFAHKTPMNKFQAKKRQAYAYCKKNGLDTTLCILVDMSIPSGKNRLFTVNFQADTNLLQGLCSHGSCAGSTGPGYSEETPIFRNTPSSYCSSIGKYKIGKRSWSNWGINVHYKLHGLDSTNNNTFRRVVVLHSYWAVPNEEIYPEYAPTSWGCPMVSDENMTLLDGLLKKKKNVLLWIYQ